MSNEQNLKGRLVSFTNPTNENGKPSCRFTFRPDGSQINWTFPLVGNQAEMFAANAVEGCRLQITVMMFPPKDGRGIMLKLLSVYFKLEPAIFGQRSS